MWSKYSYRQFKRYIDYFNHSHPIFQRLSTMPTVVSHRKVLALRHQLNQCEDGKAILIHCGDCA